MFQIGIYALFFFPNEFFINILKQFSDIYFLKCGPMLSAKMFLFSAKVTVKKFVENCSCYAQELVPVYKYEKPCILTTKSSCKSLLNTIIFTTQLFLQYFISFDYCVILLSLFFVKFWSNNM